MNPNQLPSDPTRIVALVIGGNRMDVQEGSVKWLDHHNRTLVCTGVEDQTIKVWVACDDVQAVMVRDV